MIDDIVKRFDAISARWINDAVEVKPSHVPPVLYHYTDAAGLHGMLTTGKVWLTDYRFLNDKTEIIHTYNVTKKVITEKLNDAPDSALTSFYAQILSMLERESEYPSLVFSLSEDRDDLSQWRGYARDGRGFTIGFDGVALQRASSGSGGYQFSKVEYDDAKQIDGLRRALSDMEDQLKKEVSDAATDTDKLAFEAARCFHWIVDNRGTVNKHSSFKSEREWRILEYTGKSGLITNVRASGDRLIPYCELCLLPNEKQLPIKEIGIGPSMDGNIDAQAVKILCKKTGYDPTIYFANAPYRKIY